MTEQLLCPECGSPIHRTILVCDTCDWTGDELDTIPDDKDFLKLIKKHSKARASYEKALGHPRKQKGD